MELTRPEGYPQLLAQISETYAQGRVRAGQAVNAQLIETYWRVGQHIVEFEQAGQLRAEYGKALISNLAADLGLRHGRGFSRSNLVYMRLLYLRHSKSQKPSHQLSWSHHVQWLKLARRCASSSEIHLGPAASASRRCTFRAPCTSAGVTPSAVNLPKCKVVQRAVALGRVDYEAGRQERVITLPRSPLDELERGHRLLDLGLRELAERYADPLPQLTRKVEALAAKVAGHLGRMGVVWR